MIIDLEKFIERERPLWEELERLLDRIEPAPVWKLELDQAKRLHYLYERAAASLARIDTFSSDPDVREYLESLVARAYGLIHSAGRPRRRFNPIRWFFGTFPRTFRRHRRAFALSVAITLAGVLFGGLAVLFDPDAKGVIVPFSHVQGDPSEHVAERESAGGEQPAEIMTIFSSVLFTNNVRASISAMALGATYGFGTIVLLFYNGAILGVVGFDFVRAGETEYLVGWLLPHGSVEIPAILIAGQAGLVLAAALIGRGDRMPLKIRLREILPSLATLIAGVAVLLVWAAIVEAFISQYHEPVLPYELKIAFGCVELVLLTLFLVLSGRRGAREEPVAE